MNKCGILTLEYTFFDILRSQVIVFEENVLVLSKLNQKSNFTSLTQFSGLTIMVLSRFRKLQEDCQLIISMIRNLCQEFSKQQVAQWVMIAHLGASIMFGDTIIYGAQRQVTLNLKQ